MNYYIMPGMPQTRSRARPMIIVKMDKEIIIKCVCDHFSVTIDDLIRVTRKRPVVYKRYVSMYFLVHYTNLTYNDIGHIFNKDHTTIIHGKDLIRDQIELDDNVKADIEAIKARIVEAHY